MIIEPDNSSSPSLWKGQALHLAGLVLLLAVAAFIWSLIGKPSPREFWIAIVFPILHQVWVWAAWRLELRSSAICRSVGFPAFLWVFFLLFAGRFVTLTWLAVLDQGSLGLTPMILGSTDINPSSTWALRDD